jgi:hypothetical protein
MPTGWLDFPADIKEDILHCCFLQQTPKLLASPIPNFKLVTSVNTLYLHSGLALVSKAMRVVMYSEGPEGGGNLRDETATIQTPKV